MIIGGITSQHNCCKAPFRGEDHDGWRHARRRCFTDWECWTGSCMAKELLKRCEMRLIVVCLFAAFTAGAQSTSERLPLMDTEGECPNSFDEQQQSNH